MAQETVEAPMTGKIVSINCKEGDTVQEEDVICILESMKMENPILTPVSGTVTKIAVAVDEVVNPGQAIAIIES